MLTEQKLVDRLEIMRDGTVQVREAIEVLRDGEVIARSYHRRVIDIEDDNPDLSGLDEDSIATVAAARSARKRDEAARRRTQREAREPRPERP